MKSAVKNNNFEHLLPLDNILILESLQDYYEKDEELTRISQLGENLLDTFIRNNKEIEKEIKEYCKNKRIEITKLFIDDFDNILNQIKNK